MRNRPAIWAFGAVLRSLTFRDDQVQPHGAGGSAGVLLFVGQHLVVSLRGGRQGGPPGLLLGGLGVKAFGPASPPLVDVLLVSGPFRATSGSLWVLIREPDTYAMKTGMTTLGCVVGALASLWAAAAGRAVEAENPYLGIVGHNVFGLQPPPPPRRLEDTKPPPPRILLTGITTIAGTKLALVKLTVAGDKTGAKTGEVPLTLAVGQKAEGVEVLEIHEDEPKWVKVNNHDTIMNLNFKDNGVNVPSAAQVGSPGTQVPPRQPASPITPPKNWPPETSMSPEHAAIMEAAYRMKYQKEIQAGTMPPVPGENPLMDDDNNNQQQQQQQQKRPY